MASDHRERVAVEVPWTTILKIIAAVALVWAWLHLYQLFLLLIVAVLIAVALNPVVSWMTGRGLPRWAAATLLGFGLLAMIGGFVWLTWSSLTDQASMVTMHLEEFEHTVIAWLPKPVRASFESNGQSIESYVAPAALSLVRGLGQAAVLIVLAFILTVYLLIEGRRTYQWLLAFVPPRRRAKAEQTAVESERVIFAYVAGNVATSVFATVFVLVLLSILKVPAALLLAVLAGLCDFIPVIGFILSAVPSVILALTVSPTVAIVVLLAYGGYHLAENYWISPRVYGNRLRISNVAVVLAFAVGAELAGVIGALIALPLAAVYPAIERIWLREELPETVQEHKRIERKAG